MMEGLSEWPLSAYVICVVHERRIRWLKHDIHTKDRTDARIGIRVTTENKVALDRLEATSYQQQLSASPGPRTATHATTRIVAISLSRMRPIWCV